MKIQFNELRGLSKTRLRQWWREAAAQGHFAALRRLEAFKGAHPAEALATHRRRNVAEGSNKIKVRRPYHVISEALL